MYFSCINDIYLGGGGGGGGGAGGGGGGTFGEMCPWMDRGWARFPNNYFVH